MPRKGSAKVRTGCITCKARKVKCDETRPLCSRCTSTSRKCEGYNAPPPGCYSWNELMLRAPLSFTPDASPIDSRGLVFFHQVVAPALGGPLNSSFWTRRVAQVTYHEPAVRHAVLAISSLYEDFRASSLALLPRRDENGLAIRNYNMAIKHMLALTRSSSPDTVLLTCILFVCVELLRGDAERAISHCRHGISVLNSSRTKSELAPIFRHLSIFPFFFGGAISNFPVIELVDHNNAESFEGPSQAQEALDSLLLRAVRLVRAGDAHRLGLEPQVSAALLMEQQGLNDDLAAWWCAFSNLENKDDMTSLVLEMRWLVCTIWASTCVAREETAYDAHMEKFQRVVDIATIVAAKESTHTVVRDKFSFEMGFCPLLHFMVIKCRKLSLRLQALALMKTLSRQRETMWDAAMMYAIGMKTIEVEHAIKITPTVIEAVGTERMEAMALPADEQRIRDASLEPPPEAHLVEDGTKEYRVRVSFMVRTLGGGVEAMQDWIIMPGQ